MKIEITKAKRVCQECKWRIGMGEVVGVSIDENQYGHKKHSFCKACTIKILTLIRDRIIKQLKQIRGM